MGNIRILTFTIPSFLIILSILSIKQSYCTRHTVKNTFYIRHYSGKCIEYDAVRQALSFTQICREKFRWQGGARLIHVPTKMCVNVNSTSDGSFLSLSNQCKDTSSLLMYDEGKRVIKHLTSGKCLHPEGGDAEPLTRKALVLMSGCSSETNRYYFRMSAYFIIRHFGGLCWVYSSGDNLIKLQNPIACDRFEYENSDHLRHVETGKCVIFKDRYLRLTEDCSSSQTVYNHNGLSLLQHSVTKCVHPHNGGLNPAVGNLLVLYDDGCSDEDRLRFYLYEDKDELKIRIRSESCQDHPGGCLPSRGHIFVNGHQFSINTRGINAVLFDYRSGLFEERHTYDVYASTAAKTNLANFLNGLPPDKILLLSAKDGVYLDSNSALALQKVGASATFATPTLPKVYVSLALIAYTGKARKSWEMSVNKLGGEGASIVEADIKTFHDRNGVDDCSNELGIRTGEIADSRFSAESVYSNDVDHKAFQARLYKHIPGWCSGTSSPISHHLQVDLGTVKLVSGVAIQGHGTGIVYSHYVTKFRIEHSRDGVNWQPYKGNGDLPTEFSGLGPELPTRSSTRTNWFQNTMVRYLRIIPTARVTRSGISCMRFELYGCAPRKAFIDIDDYKKTPLNLAETQKTSLSVGYVAQNNLTIGVSTAADNESLANEIDQMHIFNLNTSTTYNNGTVLKDSGDIVKVTNKAKKIDRAASVYFGIEDENFYVFGIDFEQEVLDAMLPDGIRWNTVSLETNDEVVILSKPQQINRQKDDKSILALNISSDNTEELVEGSAMQLNLSLSHSKREKLISHSNAYAVTIMMYYNSKFLQLRKLQFISTNPFSLPPSSNKTTDGMIVIQTDTFWLLNNQNILIELTFTSPKEILRGEKCSGEIIIDFAYMNNLAIFNGTANNTLEKSLQYTCKIAEPKPVAQESIRLPLPELSMVYDDLNNEVFFCYRKKSYMIRNTQFCYSQIEGDISFKSIPSVAAILGIDTQERLLYGVDRLGKSYLRSKYPFAIFDQIKESVWTAAKVKVKLQRSIASNNLASLPQTCNDSWVLSASGKQLWAATRLGLLKKRETVWNRVVSWG